MSLVGLTQDENWGDDRKSIIEYFTNSTTEEHPWRTMSEIGSLYKYIGC